MDRKATYRPIPTYDFLWKKKSGKLDRFLLATFYGKRKVVDSYLTNFFHKKVVSRNWDYLTTFFV